MSKKVTTEDDSSCPAPNCKVDPGSSQFDPLHAIYSKESVEEPSDECQSYDNIEQCITAFNEEKRRLQKADDDEIINESYKEEPEQLGRCFAPEQMMVATSRNRFRNVLMRIEQFKTGPLARIKEWRQEKVRVKVWTRGLDQIRGFATGYVAAFDKHWNLALTDVDEHFHRRRQRKTWCPDKKLNRKLLPADLPLEFKVGNSLMRVVRIEGKYEVCVRHVTQVLLRGEHVVMVAKAQPAHQEQDADVKPDMKPDM